MSSKRSQLATVVVAVLLATSIAFAQSESSEWQNPNNALDVNADGFIAADDPLIVVNRINIGFNSALPSPASSPPYLDVNGDVFLSPLDALLPMNHINANQLGRPSEFSINDSGSVRIDLQLLDSNNQVASQVNEGEVITLVASATDISPSPLGVFASYFDLAFDSSKFHVNGEVSYGDDFVNGRLPGTITDNSLEGLGAFGGLTYPSSTTSELFRVEFLATAAGSSTFGVEVSDAYSLVHGIDSPVATSETPSGAAINVVPEPSSLFLGLVMTLLALPLLRTRRPISFRAK